MDRRFLKVLGVSALFALLVSAAFYQAVASNKDKAPKKKAEREAVVAVRALPVGMVIKPTDVKLAKLAPELVPPDGFSKLEDAVGRAVVSNILPDEPVREARLAQRGAGLGLATVIPEGMRAVAVRVDDVVGVAGFVLPGMRVDVLVTGRPPGMETTVTKTILQDIQVLSAGQTLEPDAGGKAINAPVVTLLVTPAQAEALTLAGEGRIQLVLRNSADRSAVATSGRELQDLYGKPAAPPRPAPRAPARSEAARAPAAAPPPPPPTTDEIVVIRGNERSVEQVAIKGPRP
ncbi:MAG: Flp pilus assembly protein CpaB [bacterium]|jgi:pilus assembly protein CpaB